MRQAATIFEKAAKRGGRKNRAYLRALVVLHLTVLRGSAAERVIELNRLVGGNAGLVLAALAAEQKVDVVVNRRRRLALHAEEADVGVTGVELL